MANPNFTVEDEPQGFVVEDDTKEFEVEATSKQSFTVEEPNFVVEQEFEVEEPTVNPISRSYGATIEKPKTFFDKATAPLKRVPEIYTKRS